MGGGGARNFMDTLVYCFVHQLEGGVGGVRDFMVTLYIVLSKLYSTLKKLWFKLIE